MLNKSFLSPCLLLGLPLLMAAQWAYAKPAVPATSLVADGIPVFERIAVAERKEATAVRFVDWHPQRAEMLVLAPAGGSLQLHSLAEPGAKPRLLTSGRGKVETARWEPGQGEYLVFSRDRGGDEAFQLFRLHPPAPGSALAEAQALTPDGGRVSEFAFLPGGQGLVYVLDRLDRHAEPGQQGGSRQSRSQLMWVDPLKPAGGRQIAETLGGRYTDLRVAASGAVVLTHTIAGKSQTLSFGLKGEPGRVLGAAVAAADADIESDEEEELLWSRRALQGDFRQLSSLGLESGRRKAMLPELKADLEALAIPPAGSDRPFALVHNEEGVSVLRLYKLEAAAPLRIAQSLPVGLVQNPRWHPQLPLLAFDHVSAQSPGRIQVYDLARGELRAWTGGDEAPAQRETAAGLGQYETLRWTSFDGLAISGLHIAPPPRFKGPRPVYISIHGGPSSQSRPGYLNSTLRHLVEVLGVHVILPNVRGSDGFGKKFLNLDNGRRREDSVKDISALLDLIATRADMDAARVVVAGGSYGGYMSLAVAVHESARIAGSICRVGIANFASFLENTESYRRDNRRVEYGDERDPKMREFLQQISPLNHAGKVKKPLFIVHGRNDPRVPYAEAQQMVAAVRAGGAPVWFLTAEDEGHSFTNADNRDYLFQATVEFVSRLIGAKTGAEDEPPAKPAPAPEGKPGDAAAQSL